MLTSLSNSLILLQIVTFLFSVYFEAIFVTIAMVKIESIPDFYTSAIVLIN